MKIKKKIGGLIVLLLILVISACAPAIVTHAEAVDWIWGVEELESGAARIWLRHDDIAGYCTTDGTLANLAKDMAGDKVKITFETVRWGDEEFGGRGCARLSTGADTSTPIFKLTGIERLE